MLIPLIVTGLEPPSIEVRYVDPAAQMEIDNRQNLAKRGLLIPVLAIRDSKKSTAEKIRQIEVLAGFTAGSVVHGNSIQVHVPMNLEASGRYKTLLAALFIALPRENFALVGVGPLPPQP